MAFSHGSNVTIDGVTILSNYQSHAIELIAMKNTTVQNSTLKVQGRKKKKSVEEALQIDVAAPKNRAGTGAVRKEICERPDL